MADEVRTEVSEETAVARNVPGSRLDYLDGASLNKVYKNAMVIAQSDLVPDTFRNKPGNVLISMDIASRAGMPLMMVMQNLYTVHGKVGLSGQYCVAAVNSCGKFSPLSFVFVGEEGTESFGCKAVAERLYDHVVCESDTITIRMAMKEGWMGKSGSKWQTMPKQMLMYRAASFFARVYCPECLFGLQTIEELRDVNGYDEPKKQKTRITLDSAEVVAEG